MQLLAQVGTPSLHGHALALANRFRAAMGLDPGDSAIVSLANDETAADALTAAGIRSARAGRLRSPSTLHQRTGRRPRRRRPAAARQFPPPSRAVTAALTQGQMPRIGKVPGPPGLDRHAAQNNQTAQRAVIDSSSPWLAAADGYGS